MSSTTVSKIIVTLMFGFIACLAHATNTNVGPVEGRIKAVYSDFITIAVPDSGAKSTDANIDKGGDLNFRINSSATLYKNFSTLTDLKEGDKVSIVYSEERNGNMASMITKLDSADVTAAGIDAPSTTTTTTVTTTTYPG